MNSIDHLKPQAVWKYFQILSSIPRQSKKESKMTAYLQNFGIQQGLKTLVDEVGNVMIQKPATLGMKNRKGIILQAHMDMVAQKESSQIHDFEKDPIELIVEEGWVKAHHTTLGADNGIGMAMILAVLESKDIQHGPLEALFTVDEEEGMTGANHLKPNLLQGEILLNLDSDKEGAVCIGCAGGIHTDIQLPYAKESVPKGSAAFKAMVFGLKGGHSGCDIHLGRANALKLLNRFLWQATKKYGLRISSLQGGTVHNAVPFEAAAEVIISAQEVESFKKECQQFQMLFQKEYEGIETAIQLTLISSELPHQLIDLNSQKRLLNFIYACPHGVLSMSQFMPNLPETSNNLAQIIMEESSIKILTFPRSASESLKQEVAESIESLADLAGGTVRHYNAYPGWMMNPDHPLIQQLKSIYQQLYHKLLTVEATHGGLECGLFSRSYPAWQMVSLGPTIENEHTTRERVHIESVNTFWTFLLEILRNSLER